MKPKKGQEVESVKVYEDPKVFWREVSPQLKKEEAKNSLCLGLSYAFQSHPTNCMYQSALFDGNKLLGALVLSQYRTNANLLPTPVCDQEAAKILFNEFAKNELSISGIVGEKHTASLYRDIAEDAGKKTKENMVRGIYRCNKGTGLKLMANLVLELLNSMILKKLESGLNILILRRYPTIHQLMAKSLRRQKLIIK